MEKLPTADVTQLLEAWSRGEADAEEALIQAVYQELKLLAQSFMAKEGPGITLQATALVHEAYLRLIRQSEDGWKNRAHFFAIAGRMMRRVLVDHARAKGYEKRGGAVTVLSLDPEIDVPEEITEPALLALAETLEDLAAIDPDKAKLVDMRYFGGLTVPEAASILNVSEATIHRHWRWTKAWLVHHLTDGEPAR